MSSMCLVCLPNIIFSPILIFVTGTIKQAQLAAIAHNREVIARYRANRLQAGKREARLSPETVFINNLF